MDPRSQYKVLEIDRSAGLDEAKQAYRDLIAVWHPDRYTHNPRLQAKAVEKMKVINAAFEAVSRHILETGPEKSQPPRNPPGAAPSKARDAHSRTGEMDRSAAWAQTEARLAALARARQIAEARKTAEARKHAAAAGNQEHRVKGNRSRLETVNRARGREKKAAEKARLEKQLVREKAWAQTEQKLRALKLAREKAEANEAAGLPGRRDERESIGWYVKQVLIGSGILLVAFSGNAIQTVVHVSFTAMLGMLGGGLLTWWIVSRVNNSGRAKE